MRITVIAIVLLLTIAGFAVGVPWARYRCNNIVLREASVRGVVTKIGARIEGRIKSVEVEPGQRVMKGQVLLRMEDTHLEAALKRARGDLQSATLELENEKLSITQSRRRLGLEIARSQAGVKKATSEVAAQQSILNRFEKQYEMISSLVKTGAVAVADLYKITGDRDKTLAYVSAAVAMLEAAEVNHDNAVNELEGLQIRENRLGVMEAQVTVARAKVSMAESDMESAVLTAPEDGRVLECIVNVGGSAKVGEPMISLWIGKAWVEAWADERDLHQIQSGNRVDISFDANPSRKLAGRVESIGLVTDKQIQPVSVPSTLHAFVRQNAMVPIRIALEDENPPVQLGLSVLVGIRKGSENVEAVSARNPKVASAWISSTNSPLPTQRSAN
ncbi:MAG TPA: HlyD family efflux transporter periplasmic adaptor subunit [Methylomirabilota bacterium]|nr:HlyD family efflux transporter periplasmic adaptor subunit [Methylomirabilota bacterium]